MFFKFPVNSTALSLARLYAIDSFNYTYDYKGFEDEQQTDRKLRRIQIGRFGQEWIAEFCKMNNIPITADSSTAKENDDFDINISGKYIDVKTAVSTIPCQCNKAIENKKNIDMFIFLKTDSKFSFIEPVCIIPFQQYFQHAVLVRKGEMFPDTNIKNKFGEGSYVLRNPLQYGYPVINTLIQIQKYGWNVIYKQQEPATTRPKTIQYQDDFLSLLDEQLSTQEAA